MKINDHSLNGLYSQNAGGAREASHVQGANRSRYFDARNDVGVDRVEVSELGVTISNVLSTHAGERAERVQALKDAIESGSYRVNSSAIAEAMLESSFPAS